MGVRPLERRRAWIVGLVLLCCYSYFFYWGGNWNVESRNAQIFALAERGSLVIDDYPSLPETGGDAALYRGHLYSDKLLGPSLLAVPVYWLARRGLSAAGLDFETAVYLALRAANIVTNAAPTALLGALLYLFLARLGLDAAQRVWGALAYGLGTLALPYSTALFGHQLAAVCVACAFMLLWRQRERWSAPEAAGAGALAGLAAISDVMGVFIAVFLALYAVRLARAALRAQRGAGPVLKGLAAFAAAAAALAAVQLAANWLTFGGPLTFPHLYHIQESFRARHTAGLFGIHAPQLYPLYQLTIGPWRGLFYGSPVLLLALPGIFLLGKEHRAEAITIGAAWLSVLLLHSGYENWTTGSAYGPRYQSAAIPLLMLAAAPTIRRWPFVFKCLAVVSIAFTVVVTAHSPFVPEDLRNPLAVALQRFAAGEVLHGNVAALAAQKLGVLAAIPGPLTLGPLVVVGAVLLLVLRRVGQTPGATR